MGLLKFNDTEAVILHQVEHSGDGFLTSAPWVNTYVLDYQWFIDGFQGANWQDSKHSEFMSTVLGSGRPPAFPKSEKAISEMCEVYN